MAIVEAEPLHQLVCLPQLCLRLDRREKRYSGVANLLLDACLLACKGPERSKVQRRDQKLGGKPEAGRRQV